MDKEHALSTQLEKRPKRKVHAGALSPDHCPPAGRRRARHRRLRSGRLPLQPFLHKPEERSCEPSHQHGLETMVTRWRRQVSKGKFRIGHWLLPGSWPLAGCGGRQSLDSFGSSGALSGRSLAQEDTSASACRLERPPWKPASPGHGRFSCNNGAQCCPGALLWPRHRAEDTVG